MSNVLLPPRLYRGRTVRVASINCIEVNVELSFGITAKKNIVLEGVSKDAIPHPLREEALRALIVLVGGKRLLLHLDDDQKGDGYLTGRVYLDEKLRGDAPEHMATPYGTDTNCLDVAAFYSHLVGKSFNIDYIKSVLNGRSETVRPTTDGNPAHT